jgi:hypothetical protein
MLRRTLLCVLGAAVLAGPAAADTIGVTLGLTPGKLTMRAQPTMVDGTAALTVRVADGRGNGHGWTLRLKTGSGVTVSGITAACAPRSTCTLPATVGTPSGSTVLRAAPDTGMGTIDLRLTLHAAAPTSVTFALAG